MKLWFQLGYRSLIRNRRRSALTLGVVALGYAAINLMGGFMHYVFQGLEESYVHAHGNAHLCVFKQGFREQGQLDPASYLIEGDTLEPLLEACRTMEGVKLATPQLQLNGMLNVNDTSTIIFAQGIVPEDAALIRQGAHGVTKQLSFFSGNELSGDQSIGIAKGLAQMLQLEIGSDVILMATTVDGYMNALDANVQQLHDAPLELLDTMYTVLPFEYAQELYGTEGADRIRILLNSGISIDEQSEALEKQLTAQGFDVEVATWKELRVAYERIRSMFHVLFSFVFVVVGMIVILAVVNTVSTSVVERTREIGTLRALGLKRSGVIRLFTVESVFLGLGGLILGFACFIATRSLIALAQPSWIPPNIPKRVPWEIAWAPGTLLLSALLIFLLTLIAAMIPARRASKTEIIEALGHV